MEIFVSLSLKDSLIFFAHDEIYMIYESHKKMQIMFNLFEIRCFLQFYRINVLKYQKKYSRKNLNNFYNLYFKKKLQLSDYYKIS